MVRPLTITGGSNVRVDLTNHERMGDSNRSWTGDSDVFLRELFGASGTWGSIARLAWEGFMRSIRPNGFSETPVALLLAPGDAAEQLTRHGLIQRRRLASCPGEVESLFL